MKASWVEWILFLSSLQGVLLLFVDTESPKRSPAPPEPQVREETLRQAMVRDQIRKRGVDDPKVLAALREVPRHRFVPAEYRHLAYDDTPLPIGLEQTISQPYMVAMMTEELGLESHHKVFELGTGSGYQAAVASRIAKEVYSVEIVPELAERATVLLAKLGYDNVHVRVGDGWAGWPDQAPFDRIFVTAAAEEIPKPLLEQLRVGGKMILPLGAPGRVQELVLVEKHGPGKATTRSLTAVRFVPVTGDH